MSIVKVTSKATGEVVYSYEADAPVEWSDFPFDAFDHLVVPDVVAPVELTPPLFGGRRKLTKLEYRKLMRPHEEVKFDRIRATFETDPAYSAAQRDMVRTFNNKYNEATIMDLDDPDQPRALMLFLALGALDGAFRMGEILRG